ncbi:LysR family transcriptional regulator [Pontibaca salina]|uniref:LysR family transcriptional regulator n=1 Tax=Pontibaca salina TaxID=2795731 RepID=A0A934HTR3_9RHOB|nr:LysR family transcriptional regulator [Pontibaca salina]MBI6629439.1 LysR family transcriptional regulator [Pontibaca salina]
MSDRPFDNLPLEWVRAFEAAGRTGSFTAAAHEIDLTQAAISQRIANLEAMIGARLFLRQRRGVALTVEGEAWLPHVSHALTLLQQSSEDLFSTRRRKITISASASVIQNWLVPRLTRLEPDDRMQISFSTMVVAADFDRQADTVEIRHGNGLWPGRRTARLFAEELAPVASPHLLNAGERWQDLPKIAVSGPRPGWQEWGEYGDRPHVRFDTMTSAIAAAVAGVGVLLASLPLCAEALKRGDLVPLSDHKLHPSDSYWFTASEAALPARQWERLTGIFCSDDAV